MTEDRVFIKCAWRLIPFIALLYLINRLDRTNVAFAALTMNRDLGFSAEVYGFGAGLFFAGYALFQLPANLILDRAGTKRWMFVVLLSWGAISMANALIRDPQSFYALRLSLGVAEAGLFPGMVLYVSLWFPKVYRARFMASFLLALPVANIVGGPLSGFILGMDGVLGLRGWQWLFLIEGVPAVILAFAALKMLPDGPQAAPWLSVQEKATIAATLSAEDSAARRTLLPALFDPRVLALCLVYFAFEFGFGSLTVWLAPMVQAMGYEPLVTTEIVAALYALAIPAMILWSRSSDRRADRTWHSAIACVTAAAGFALASFGHFNPVILFGLCVAVIGAECFLPVFFSLPSSFLSGPAAAGGIALISMAGNVGGFIGPAVVGSIKDVSGSFSIGLGNLAAGMVFAGIISLLAGQAIAAPGSVPDTKPSPQA